MNGMLCNIDILYSWGREGHKQAPWVFLWLVCFLERAALAPVRRLFYSFVPLNEMFLIPKKKEKKNYLQRSKALAAIISNVPTTITLWKSHLKDKEDNEERMFRGN